MQAEKFKEEEIGTLLLQSEDMFTRCRDLYTLSQAKKIKDLETKVATLESTLTCIEKSSSKQNFCKICFENPVNVSLAPCGHRVMCSRCCEEFKKKKMFSCPICRHYISQFVVTYD